MYSKNRLRSALKGPTSISLQGMVYKSIPGNHLGSLNERTNAEHRQLWLYQKHDKELHIKKHEN